jgi:hypothetical protein
VVSSISGSCETYASSIVAGFNVLFDIGIIQKRAYIISDNKYISSLIHDFVWMGSEDRVTKRPTVAVFVFLGIGKSVH